MKVEYSDRAEALNNNEIAKQFCDFKRNSMEAAEDFGYDIAVWQSIEEIVPEGLTITKTRSGHKKFTITGEFNKTDVDNCIRKISNIMSHARLNFDWDKAGEESA